MILILLQAINDGQENFTHSQSFGFYSGSSLIDFINFDAMQLFPLHSGLIRTDRTIFLLGLLMFAAVLGTNLASAQILDRPDLVAALDSAAQAHAADSTVAGISVAVTRGSESLLHKGYGQADVELDVPTPRDAIYEVGSITKQFTAAAILQLAAKDSIDLDAPINEYLSDYDTRGHRVTVRQLLYHTSGLRDYTTLSEFQTLRHRNLPQDTVLALVEREPFRFAPGSAMSYSNSGYYLLGKIVEETSGQSYTSYIESRLLAPAGMDDSYYCDEYATLEDRAHGYSWSRSGLQLREGGSHSTWSYATGGLCSTAIDLLAWNQALHGGEILPDSIYEKMIAPGRLADGTKLRHGMGLAVANDEGRRAIGYFGGLAGFLSASIYYPDTDLIVVVLQNTWGPQAAWNLADDLARLALGPGDQPEPEPYGGDLSPLTGRYAGPARGGQLRVLRIRAEGGHLLASEMGSRLPPDTLQHARGLTWRGPNRYRFGTDHYRFVRAGEQVVALRQDEIFGHYVLRRIGDL